MATLLVKNEPSVRAAQWRTARPQATRATPTTTPSHGEPGSAADGSQTAAAIAPAIDTRTTASARTETLVARSAILSLGLDGVYPVPADTTIQAHHTAATNHGLMAAVSRVCWAATSTSHKIPSFRTQNVRNHIYRGLHDQQRLLVGTARRRHR